MRVRPRLPSQRTTGWLLLLGGVAGWVLVIATASQEVRFWAISATEYLLLWLGWRALVRWLTRPRPGPGETVIVHEHR